MTQRTSQQNRAIHKHCELVAKEAQDTGITFTEFIRRRPQLEMYWTLERVKSLWQEAAFHMYGTRKTSRLQTEQVTVVYDVVNKALGEIMGFNVPFPSLEEIKSELPE